jgi:hypothetical protein
MATLQQRQIPDAGEVDWRVFLRLWRVFLRLMPYQTFL